MTSFRRAESSVTVPFVRFEALGTRAAAGAAWAVRLRAVARKMAVKLNFFMVTEGAQVKERKVEEEAKEPEEKRRKEGSSEREDKITRYIFETGEGLGESTMVPSSCCVYLSFDPTLLRWLP
jgi:hypothetical protein